MGNRRCNSRANSSMLEYVDKLFDTHSRIQAIRLDLGYRKDVAAEAGLEDIKRNVKRMLDNRRMNAALFSGMVGYINKFENTEERGPHVHTLLLFDGHELQKDAYRADQIGEYWKTKITNKEGTFHNCNAEKSKYHRCGVGMVDYSDQEKRKILREDVVSYLSKDDQRIDEIKGSAKDRSFTRGVTPSRKSAAGRPRKYED